ncbi:MAG: VOC family protein [Pseudomonadota bacterium]|nr:VOC family protein [Pseudomonadota bacterium]
MKRFHVHVNVIDLDASIGFYSTLFGVAPEVRKPDYAKWMLDDPRVNFAISQRDRAAGVDHLGLQADDGAELEVTGARLAAADAVALAERGTTCCYAHSDKYWAEDPQGVRWEIFHTHGTATTYSSPTEHASGEAAACCGLVSSELDAAFCCATEACG